MNLYGIHHVTAVTTNAKSNLDFYTRVLGLRLVKKTVNQDDVRAYHLFYADNEGSPGTDLTFFKWNTLQEKRGTDSVVRTAYHLRSSQALNFWKERFSDFKVRAGGIYLRDGRETLEFEDPEGQRLMLVVDPDAPAGKARYSDDIKSENQLQGLGPAVISVSDFEATSKILVQVMGFEERRSYETASSVDSAGKCTAVVFGMGGQGVNAELHVLDESGIPGGRAGSGGVHHIAFRIRTFEEYDEWAKRLKNFRIPSSGPVNRYYFKSLYLREPGGILFELATDEPGFLTDEPLETLGQNLSLPPFLESRREEIEEGLEEI